VDPFLVLSKKVLTEVDDINAINAIRVGVDNIINEIEILKVK
jgi:hypothetical protein